MSEYSACSINEKYDNVTKSCIALSEDCGWIPSLKLT